MPKYYDNTRLSAFKECPRKYYLRHVKHLRKDSTALPLVFGLAWHDAMDVVWGLAQGEKSNEEIAKLALVAFNKTWVENGLPSFSEMTLEDEERLTPRTPGVAAEMLLNYIEQRRDFIKDCEILAIERPFAVPLRLGNSDEFYIGRLDKLVKRHDGIWPIEHKTSSAYAKASGFRRDYIESWSPNSQIDGYNHAAKMLEGMDARGLLIDAALVHKQVHDVFKFIPVERAFSHIEGWREEAEAWIAKIQESKKKLENGSSLAAAFPRNTESCYGKYGPCAFVDICRFTNDPSERTEFEGYIVDEWQPFNILELEKIGMEPEK